MDHTCQLKSWHCSDSYYDKSFFKALMPSMATTYHESSPTSGTGSGIESDGLKVGLDTSTGPYLAKGQTLRWRLTYSEMVMAIRCGRSVIRDGRGQ